MKTVKDRKIKETIRLADCSIGDRIRFPWTDKATISGEIIIVKIKPIPKNKIQIKYRSAHNWRSLNNTLKENPVLKIDLPMETQVERTRNADYRENIMTKICDGEIIT